MKIREIQDMPTSQCDAGSIHESVFRSYHILEKVKYLLEEGVPAKACLELIKEMQYSKKIPLKDCAFTDTIR